MDDDSKQYPDERMLLDIALLLISEHCPHGFFFEADEMGWPIQEYDENLDWEGEFTKWLIEAGFKKNIIW